MNKQTFPNSLLLPIQARAELPRTVFPKEVPQVGVRINFVQEVPLDLKCLTMIWAICVVESVSINLDILTLEF